MAKQLAELLLLGDGRTVGDYRIIGNDMGRYIIERIDNLEDGGEVQKWTKVGIANTPDAALRGLDIIIKQDTHFLREWATRQDRIERAHASIVGDDEGNRDVKHDGR